MVFYCLEHAKTHRSIVHFEKKGSLSHLNRVCVWSLFFYYFFQQKKEINKLAVRCTDFLFVVEILGCWGRKPLPILAQMLIVSCNSSWLPLRCSQLPFICCFSQTEVITNYIPCCTQEVGHLVFFSFVSVLEPK